MLPPKVQMFVREYLVDLNAGAAYARAGYKAKGNSRDVCARRLLRNAQVAAEIARLQTKVLDAIELTAEKALSEAWNIATADARELVEYRVQCCHHCHGKGFAYQWTKREFEKAVERFEEEREAGGKRAERAIPPDPAGGMDFDARKGPNADCPECLGAGYGRVMLRDTRNLSPAALSLYAGVKQTKEGVEVKMHSKLDALEKVFKHLGLYEKDNDQKKPELAEAMAEFFGQLHEGGHARLPFVPRVVGKAA